MRNRRNNRGFSLTEVLMAVGILGIGMIFIAGAFPVGVYFTTVATERTIAAVAADEAFAKVRLYGVDVNDVRLTTKGLMPFSALTPTITSEELMYPSTSAPMSRKQYYWVALCRRVSDNSRLVQVTVFVSRKLGASTKYYWRLGEGDWPKLEERSFPRPILVSIVQSPGTPNELLIKDAVPSDPVDERTFINDGCTIVDDENGQIYRVLERDADQPDKILLDRNWEGVKSDGWVWVGSPAVGGGRYPCIAIYQKVIRF